LNKIFYGRIKRRVNRWREGGPIAEIQTERVYRPLSGIDPLSGRRT